MSILTKHKNPGAYSGTLRCPVCQSEAVRFIENIGPYRIRYRCRKCGLPFQYDTSYAPPGSISGTHPYALFKKPKFNRIIERFEYGRTQKGERK